MLLTVSPIAFRKDGKVLPVDIQLPPMSVVHSSDDRISIELDAPPTRMEYSNSGAKESVGGKVNFAEHERTIEKILGNSK